MPRSRLIPAVTDITDLNRRRKEEVRRASGLAPAADDNSDSGSEVEENQQDEDSPHCKKTCRCAYPRKKSSRVTRNTGNTSCSGCPFNQDHYSILSNCKGQLTLKQAMHVHGCYVPMLKEGYRGNKLHLTAMCGDKGEAMSDLLNYISKSKGSLYSVDSAGNTPLMLACAAQPCSLSLIEELLTIANDDYVNMQNEDGLTALHFATLNDAPEVVDLLLSKNANVNAGIVNVNDKQYGLTPLLISIIAFKHGIANDCLDNLLKYNPDLTVELAEAANVSEGLNFRWECDCGGCVSNKLAFSIESILPPSKISTGQWTRAGNVMFQAARHNYCTSKLAYLMQHMSKRGVFNTIMDQPTHMHNMTPFGVATNMVHYNTMHEILRRDISFVNRVASDLSTMKFPLHILLERPRRFENCFRCTDCSNIIVYDKNAINHYVDLFLKTTVAQVDIENSFGQTPLMLAAKNGHEYACEKLIELGADPLKCDCQGNSPMEYAMTQEPQLRVKIFRILLKTGCSHDLAKQPLEQSRLLREVMENRDVVVLKLLHRAGAIDEASRVQMIVKMGELNHTSDEDAKATNGFRDVLNSLPVPPTLKNLCLLTFSFRQGKGIPADREGRLRVMITPAPEPAGTSDNADKMEVDQNSIQTAGSENETKAQKAACDVEGEMETSDDNQIQKTDVTHTDPDIAEDDDDISVTEMSGFIPVIKKIEMELMEEVMWKTYQPDFRALNLL